MKARGLGKRISFEASALGVLGMQPWCLSVARKYDGEELGLHLMLKPGWCYGSEGFHELVEATLTGLLSAARFVKPCDCEVCRPAPGRKSTPKNDV